MNRIPRVRRAIAILSGLAIAILGLAAAAPGAFARVMPPSGGTPGFTAPAAVPAVTRIVVVGGTPGWQIALIAAGTALIVGALAVLADRARAARRRAGLRTA
jgi:hypothetical protein